MSYLLQIIIMNRFKLIGQIKEIRNLREFGKSNYVYQKREVILVYKKQNFEQILIIDFIRKDVSLLNDFSKNDRVKIDFFIQGREWVSKEGLIRYFNSLIGFKISKAKDHEENTTNYMAISGKIKSIRPIKVSDKGYKKRILILTTYEKHSQHVAIEFLNDKTELLNDFKEGSLASVSINLKGMEWRDRQGKSKFFNSIIGWQIKELAAII